MTVQEIDRALQRLGDAAEAIRSNLLEVELDPNRKLLDASALEGETARRWSEASAMFARLWQWHALLDGLLERAHDLRGGRPRPPAKRVEQLSDMLSGASIELASEYVPLEQRDLLGHAALRCTPDALLEQATAAFDRAKTVLGAVNDAWGSLSERLATVRGVLDRCAALARELGEGAPQQLDRVRARLGELNETLTKDPLSVQGDEVATLEHTVHAAMEDLQRLDRVRLQIDALLADARGLLSELRCVTREGREAREQAHVKIAAAKLPEPPCLDDALERQLQDVEKIARHGAWREARTVLEQWTGRARGLLEQAQAVVQQSRAPIGRRDELRGLLDACQAKALALGLIEDVELAQTFTEAQRCLYTAPTDLSRAEELVHRYRQALTTTPASREPAR